ncbi:MAG: acyltransferase domain-containing protein, partial [Pseudomonadota bacterium]
EAFEVADRIAGHQPSWQEMSFPGFLGNIIAGRVTNRLDFGGTNYIVDAACASALAALSAAMNELYLGQCDLAVSGGVDLLTDIGSFVSFSRTGALSKKGDCRPFSKNADGTVIGEGIVLVGLRRLEDAERDGDKIYAVIRGHGTSSDGRGSAIYAPRAEGQVRAMERAYEAAGYSPQTVGLAEAHGTGTPLGDATEVKSMSQVLGGPGRRVRCALGSVKSQIGHPKTSAGAVALMKVASALHERILPPTIKVDEPNDQLQAEDCPLYLNTTARPWISGEEHLRRASLSAFGFGGTNAHLTVEEYEGAHRAKRRLKFPSQLFMFGGADRAAVLRAAAAVVKQAEDGFAFDALAKASQETFDRKAAVRLALVAATPVKFSALFEKVSGLLKDGGALPANFEGAAFSDAAPLDGDVAFLFPGQGSQSLGMGGEIAMHFEAARKIWDEEAQRARIEGRRALHSVVFPEPTWDEDAKSQQESALKATEVAQPALAVTELSYLALMKSVGVSCDLAIGHSFGEIIALHQAGAFNAEAAVRIAEKRGALMSSAGAGVKGAMVAVSLEKQAVEAAIEASGADAGIANENAPKQTVVSGRLEEIEKFEAELPGGAFRRLPVSSAFHSSVVAGASSVFEAYLAGVWRDAPQGEVIANTTAAPYGQDIASCRSTLAEQISKPVKFVDSVRAAHAKGVRIFVEVGPGDVLTKLT